MNTFILNRLEDESGVSGTGVVAEGIMWSDRRVALHWVVGTPSTTIFDSIEDVFRIHGHQGKTEIVWNTE